MEDKNVMAKAGWARMDGSFSDADYRETFNIPEDQDVNEFMYEYSRKENIKHYQADEGMTLQQATAKANQRAASFKKMNNNS